MRKPDFCLCENKGADQLRSNCEADQRLSIRYMDSTIPLLLKSRILSFCPVFYTCTGWFVSDGNPDDRFSRITAHLCFLSYSYCMSRLMRKPTICICENKDADQLRSNCEADQRLFFRYTDSTLLLLLKSEMVSF